jgi:recombination protein RecT
MSDQLATISNDIINTKAEFQAVLADPSINFEREAEFAIQVLEKNDYALRIALGNRNAVVAAVKNIAAIGISLNPAKKQAYLVPRGGAICLDISYMGLMDLAIATGSIRWAQAELVRAADEFALQGFDQPPVHKFNPFKPAERGEIIGVYVVVKTADGDYLTHAMPIDEVYAIRERSESWKAYLKDNKKKNPWLTDPGEMIKKTCVKQAYKYWPKTDRLDTAIHHLNTDGGEGLAELAGNAPADAYDVQPLIDQALATATDADALAFWRTHNKALVEHPAAHAKLKEAVAGHRAKMKADAAQTVEHKEVN